MVTAVNLEDFEKWIDSSHRKTKAVAEYKSVKSVEKQSSSTHMEGKTPLKDVEELLGITFDEEEFETLNGFLISRLDRIPEPDEQFDVDYKGYHFKILSVVKKMIGSVLVRKLPEEKTPQNAEDGQSVLEEKRK